MNGQEQDQDQDKDYIIRIIQYLDYSHNITFFITPKDFDALYNWWQKRIPMKVIRESINDVVKRWQAQKKPVTGFTSFKYTVRKNFQSFLQLNVADAQPQQEKTTDSVTAVEASSVVFDPFEDFLTHFPELLEPLRAQFEALFKGIKLGETVDPAELHRALRDLFADDEQLNIKSSLFLRNLPAQMRKPEIENRYRLNFIINKFRIPGF